MANIGSRSTASGSGTSLTPTAVKTATYSAAVGDLAKMNVSGGGTVLNLPAAPLDKALVGYLAIGATTAVPLVINAGGSDTIGTAAAASVSIPLAGEMNIFQYQASTTNWNSVSNVKPLSSLDGRYAPTGLVASGVPSTAVGHISSTNVQAALAELDTKKVAITDAATLSNTAPLSPSTTASAGAAATAMRSDAVITAPGLYAWYGTAVDGSVVLDGTSTVAGFSRSGTTYTAGTPSEYLNLTVNAGVTVNMASATLLVLGTLTNNGTIQNKGGNASGTNNATGGAGGGTSPGSVYALNRGGNGTTGGTGAGGAGGATSGSFGGSNSNLSAYGGASGAGGAGSGGAGGAAAAQAGAVSTMASYPVATALRRAPWAFTGQTPDKSSNFPPIFGGSGGAAGGGDGTNAGGGGGGGGGPMVINARVIVNNGSINCNGGTGGSPATGNCGGGGGGGGGVLLINTTTPITGSGGTITATAGTGGAGVGTGVAGGAGAVGYVQTTVWP